MTPSPAEIELARLNLVQMFGLLIGGLALFLLGLEFMTAGLKSIAGSRLQALDRKSTRLNSSHRSLSRMPSSA